MRQAGRRQASPTRITGSRVEVTGTSHPIPISDADVLRRAFRRLLGTHGRVKEGLGLGLKVRPSLLSEQLPLEMADPPMQMNLLSEAAQRAEHDAGER